MVMVCLGSGVGCLPGSVGGDLGSGDGDLPGGWWW